MFFFSFYLGSLVYINNVFIYLFMYCSLNNRCDSDICTLFKHIRPSSFVLHVVSSFVDVVSSFG